jgi:putative PIN family toxin of toxin-antitoxin system
VRPIAVFDTNVLFSATIWRGRPFDSLELARAALVEGLTCPEILLELADKLRVKTALSDQHIADMVADLLGFLRPVTIAGALRVVDQDPDDDKIIECALEGRATHIVTGDRRHLLKLGTYENIAIVSPAEFLAAVRTGRIGE